MIHKGDRFNGDREALGQDTLPTGNGSEDLGFLAECATMVTRGTLLLG
jgi:hypothetical protein